MIQQTPIPHQSNLYASCTFGCESYINASDGVGYLSGDLSTFVDFFVVANWCIYITSLHRFKWRKRY